MKFSIKFNTNDSVSVMPTRETILKILEEVTDKIKRGIIRDLIEDDNGTTFGDWEVGIESYERRSYGVISQQRNGD
jgi:hypothetical protein